MTELNNEEPLIEFVSMVPGLTLVEECLPKRTSKFVPEWWKKTPLLSKELESYFDPELKHTVKNCPSFPEYFGEGFIVPMWTDSVLRYEQDTDTWAWQTRNSNYSWELHSKAQLGPHFHPRFYGKSGFAVFKALCPWRMKTPLGYSVLQLPVFYDLNPDFTVFPGVIRTDNWGYINQQVLLHSDKTEVFIPRGTPLAQYIPFKRTKYEYEVREATEEDKLFFAKQDAHITTKFIGSSEYHKFTRQEEKRRSTLDE